MTKREKYSWAQYNILAEDLNNSMEGKTQTFTNKEFLSKLQKMLKLAKGCNFIKDCFDLADHNVALIILKKTASIKKSAYGENLKQYELDCRAFAQVFKDFLSLGVKVDEKAVSKLLESTEKLPSNLMQSAILTSKQGSDKKQEETKDKKVFRKKVLSAIKRNGWKNPHQTPKAEK